VDQDVVLRVIERCDADDISVFGFERRAGEDNTLGATRELGERGAAEGCKPVPTVSIRERDVCGHLIDIGLGVVLCS